MRLTRTRQIKWVASLVAFAFILVQLIGSVGIARKTFLSDESYRAQQAGSFEDSNQISKTNLVQDISDHRISVSSPPSVKNTSTEKASRNKNILIKGSQEVEGDIKKPNSSLTGERTHGLVNGNHATEVDTSVNITSILQQVRKINQEEIIRNEDLFGPVTNETLVIAIQVHNRIQYLRHLIVSLSQATDIEKCLLIFSHDFWDEPINDLISSIDFAKTLQIFYPLSIQTHPNTFPGETPDDCPRNAKKDQAKRLQCINSDWPDLYGHYREAKFTQTKHHWWWKANRIFHQLKALKNFDGLVLFLEEDHYVAEDFVSSLRLAESVRNKSYPDCDIICIGTYLKTHNYNRDHKTLELTKWVSAKHNMGMAFNRSLWQKIYSCREVFCNFDDYNWDWSLEHVSNNCIKDGLQVLLFKGPRVFHIGECGVHHKKKTCEPGVVIQKVRDILVKASGYLYPQELTVTRVVQKKKKIKQPKGNGGWGDLRDHKLCLKFSDQNETSNILAGNISL